MNISKLMAVAYWEFIEKAKTKTFLISLVATPIIMVGFGILPSIFAMQEDSETKKFLWYDQTQELTQPVQKEITQRYVLDNGKPNFELVPISAALSPDSARAQITREVAAEKYEGGFLLLSDIDTSRKMEYRALNVGNQRDIERIGSAVENILISNALSQQGIAKESFEKIAKEIKTNSFKISKTGEVEESSFLQTIGTVYASFMILLILIMTTGQMLVRGLVEEKGNRIIEILLSSCSPFELMMGKLLGLSGLGVLQLVVWAGMGIAATIYMGGSLAILDHLPLALVYTILGYILYASIFLGIGSLTSTEQEAQQATGYATLLLITPMMIIIPLVQNPNSMLVKVLSYIPFMTPSLMLARLSIQVPSPLEIALTIVVLLISSVVVTWLAAKIFRVAILSYGKRLTLPEIINLIKS